MTDPLDVIFRRVIRDNSGDIPDFLGIIFPLVFRYCYLVSKEIVDFRASGAVGESPCRALNRRWLSSE